MPSFDPVLEPYARASADDSDRVLAELLGGATERAIRGIIAHTLGSLRRSSALAGIDADDVHADVVLQLVSRLRRFKQSPHESAIEKFAAYVASTTYRTCYSCLRRLYPARTRLKSRIRYALASDERFVIERDELGIWRCGRAVQTVPASVPDAAAQFERDPIAFAREALRALPSESRRDAAALIEPVLLRVGQPVDLDSLVDAVASILGLDERPHTRGSIDDPELDVDVADGSASIADTLMNRQYLSHLWDEVRDLPVRQRIAVLLNLRDEDGQSALPLLPLTGIATIRDIAAVLELPAAELAAIWRDLPLEDERIGSRLKVTRQQVINLRKSARARLERRMLRFGNTARK